MDSDSPEKSKKITSNLSKRIFIGATAGPFIFFATIFSEHLFIVLLFILLIFSLKEVLSLVQAIGEQPFSWLCWILGLSLFTMSVLSKDEYVYKILFLSIFVFSAGLIFQKDGAGVVGASLSFFWTLYVSLGIGSLIFLYRFQWTGSELMRLPYAGGRTVSLILLLVWTLDTAAYFIGRRFGRRPFFQWISPKKTIEGAVGGFLCTLIMAAAAHFIYVSFIPLHHVLALGLIVGVGGQIGDLVESSLKRRAALKDSSTIIPGHGGVLDRFDSLFFSAPLIFMYVTFAF